MDDIFYRSLVRDIFYLIAIMQDLMFATSLLFRFMNSLSHFQKRKGKHTLDVKKQ
jgi:hypothetical protein